MSVIVHEEAAGRIGTHLGLCRMEGVVGIRVQGPVSWVRVVPCATVRDQRARVVNCTHQHARVVGLDEFSLVMLNDGIVGGQDEYHC
jgi:hypothetical protein